MKTIIKDEVQEYLQELKKSKKIILTIPDHPLIIEAEKELQNPVLIQRMWMLLHYTFITRKNSLRINDRETWYGFLDIYTNPIYADECICLLSRNDQYRLKILETLSKLDIITLIIKSERRELNGKCVSSPNIYYFNEKICKTNKTRIIELTDKEVINSHNKYFCDRYSIFKDGHKKIINRNLLKSNINVSGLEFFNLYYKDFLKEIKDEELKKSYSASKKCYITLSRSEHIRNFKKTFIRTCREIDEYREQFESRTTIMRFMNCFFDDFGNRFHHMFTNHYSILRNHITLDRIDKLIPLFEIDVTSSQPTMTAILMEEKGIIDTEFFNALNNGCLYEKYMDKTGLNRKESKTLFFKALFGSANSKYLKDLESTYPEMVKYIRNIKSTNLIESGTVESSLKNYKLSSGNCLLVQRRESEWSYKVWNKLINKRIRFIPIHDSVIIFGKKSLSEKEILELEKEVREIMLKEFNLTKTSDIKPQLHTKFYVSLLKQI